MAGCYEEVVERCAENECLKPNGDTEVTEGLVVECDDIENAECVPILSDRIFDYICLQSKQFSSARHTFTIDPAVVGRYKDGDPICIDNIGLTYDFIGLRDPEVEIQMDEDTKIVKPPTGSGYDGCKDDCSGADATFFGTEEETTEEEEPSNDGTLYDEYVGTISNRKYSCLSDETSSGIKSRYLSKNLEYYACNLRLVVTGRIGCKTFSASYAYDQELEEAEDSTPCSPIPIVGLNFNPVNFYGKIGRSTVAKRVTLAIEHNACLAVERVRPLTRYHAPEVDEETEIVEGSFDAVAEYSFVVNHSVHSTVSEKLAVFTSQNGVSCQDGSMASSCDELL